MAKPNILLFDIETIPNMNEAMKVWCQLGLFPGRTMKATVTSLLCVGYKELESKRTYCINAWDFPEWDKDINDDKAITKAIHQIMSQADGVITHNGKRFDWKYLQTKFLMHGLDPLPKIPHVDTCAVARSNLFSFSNKLDYLGEYFVKDRKLENGGWDLWVKVSKRIKKYQDLMERYCKQDVDLLEKLYLKLRPLTKGLPNANIYNESKWDKVCPKCGSANFKANGWRYTATQKYQRYRCKSCKGYFRGDLKGNNPREL